MTGYGFAGTLAEDKWALLAAAMSYPGHIITTGGVASVGVGPRNIAWTAVKGVAAGIYFDEAAGSVAFDANAGSTNRTDCLIVEIDWAGAGSVTVKVLKGTSADKPALTQTPGTLWQVPLAWITVRPSVTTFLSSDIALCRPLRQRDIPYLLTPSGQELGGSGALQHTLETQAIPDPGWPYYIECVGMLHVTGDSGYTRVDVYHAGSTGLAFGASGNTSEGAKSSVPIVGTSATLTGPQTVTVKARVMSGTGGANTTVLASRVLLTVKPA